MHKIIHWQANKVSETLSGLNNENQRYVLFIYVRFHLVVRALCYVKWVELCEPFQSNHWQRQLKCFKKEFALWFLFSIQSSEYGATTVVKLSYTLTECGPL